MDRMDGPGRVVTGLEEYNLPDWTEEDEDLSLGILNGDPSKREKSIPSQVAETNEKPFRCVVDDPGMLDQLKRLEGFFTDRNIAFTLNQVANGVVSASALVSVRTELNLFLDQLKCLKATSRVLSSEFQAKYSIFLAVLTALDRQCSELEQSLNPSVRRTRTALERIPGLLR